jgi:hypothetical protein
MTGEKENQAGAAAFFFSCGLSLGALLTLSQWGRTIWRISTLIGQISVAG